MIDGNERNRTGSTGKRTRRAARAAHASLAFALLWPLAMVLAPAPADAYGFQVHRLVNRAATTHLPAHFAGFAQWVDDLERLSTAADERKGSVQGERIKHYIDIDDYPEFFAGTLPHTFDGMVAKYGLARVEGNGTVPWAIEDNYETLVAQFEARDWPGAVATAADIGHYVADTHNPMHLTLNYNGQLTGQNGIHSRHESQMTGRHLGELVPAPAPGDVRRIANPREAVFDWIDDLYPGVRKILDADTNARDEARGSTSNEAYFDVLWREVGSETTEWLRDASVNIARVWYSAWLEAGSPAMPGDPPGSGPPPANLRTRMLANVPNPFNPTTTLRFELAHAGLTTLRIVDAVGREVRTFDLGSRDEGPGEFEWDGTGVSGERAVSGVYFVIVTDARGGSATGRVVLLK
ncbi:MAG: hypothetical protein HKN20_12015 [Gemmatimonadetes bacterium]|nr:hypothetical protein [Gemmatimonadota bacterium]